MPDHAAVLLRLVRALARTLRLVASWPWRDTLRTLRQRFGEDRLGVTAGSLTFTTTIAIVPLVTVMLAVFTAFPIFQRFRGALQDWFLRSLVPERIATPVMGGIAQFAQKASRLGSVGLAVLLLSALALMLTIDRSLNNIWRVPRPRPIAQRVLVYWAAATLGPLVLGVSLTITSYAIGAGRGLFAALPGGVAALLAMLQFALMWLGMTALFRFVPATHVRWGWAAAGGFFVALGFEVTKRALAWYLHQVPTYTTIYGAFATVPIFLVWLYLDWVVALLGAVVAAYGPSLMMGAARRAASPGWRFDLALTLVRELQAARQGAAQGLSVAQLARQLRADPLQVEPLLDLLADLHWVARLDEEGDARHVLLCQPGQTPVEPLVSRVLLAHGPAVHRFWQRARLGDISLAEAISD